MKRKIKSVVNSPNEFENPIYCYVAMRQWMQYAGEDFVDYHSIVVDHKDNKVRIIDWLLNKGYISKEKYDDVISQKLRYVQELLFNYKEGIMNYGECSFPANLKSYQLVAEYISENDEARQRLFEATCTDNKINCVYTDDNGNILSACIYECDLLTNTISKEQWLKEGWRADISFTDEYGYLKAMSIKDADYNIDE